MILSDREIQIALARRMVRITPEITPDRYASTTIDLTLDGPLQQWKAVGGHGLRTHIDPMDPGFNVTELANEHTSGLDCDQGIEIEPGSFVVCALFSSFHEKLYNN